VFVDIGDKSWGVRACQSFFAGFDNPSNSLGSIAATNSGAAATKNAGIFPIKGAIPGAKTLHVGDQFLSAGANDFKARLACTTAWIASPYETVKLLEEMGELDSLLERKVR